MILPSTKNEAASNLLTCCFSIISIFFFVCLFLWNCFECGYEFLQDCRVNNGEQNAKNRNILSAIVSKRQASKCQVVIFYGTGFISSIFLTMEKCSKREDDGDLKQHAWNRYQREVSTVFIWWKIDLLWILDAMMHLYKRVCLSVGQLVHYSISLFL